MRPRSIPHKTAFCSRRDITNKNPLFFIRCERCLSFLFILKVFVFALRDDGLHVPSIRTSGNLFGQAFPIRFLTEAHRRSRGKRILNLAFLIPCSEHIDDDGFIHAHIMRQRNRIIDLIPAGIIKCIRAHRTARLYRRPLEHIRIPLLLERTLFFPRQITRQMLPAFKLFFICNLPAPFPEFLRPLRLRCGIIRTVCFYGRYA